MVKTKDETSVQGQVEEGKNINRKNYYKEIMYEGDFSKAENIFYEFMEYGSKRERKSVFAAILMRADSYEKAEELVCYMNKYGFKADMQIYDILLKKMENREDIINLYNKLKSLCFIMDEIFLKRVADKMIATDEYYQIQYERDCFKQIHDEAEKIENQQDLINSIENLFSYNDIEETTYNYFIFISLLKKASLVKKCIEILHIRKIKIDEKIYIAVLNKLIEDNKERIIYMDILKNLQRQIDDDEKRKLIDILNYHSKETGGETKWILEKDKLIKEYNNEILLESDVEKQQFLIGKAEALSFKSKGINKKLEKELNEIIIETKAEEDFELYRLEISKLYGQLSGIQESHKLYSSIKQNNMPILYIVYVESREFLYEIENEYIKDYYYESEKINHEKVNSFMIASSAEEFIHYLDEADYKQFDVRVKIYGDSGDSRQFYTKGNNNKRIYEYMHSVMDSKICFLTYTQIQFIDKEKNKTAADILSRDDIHLSNDNILLDNYYTIRYIQSLKNNIDLVDADELIRFQKLGNYYISILKGMLNRCIRTDQKDWKFIFTIMDYDERADIKRDVQNIHEIQEIISLIRIDKGRIESIRSIIKEHLDSLEKNRFFERLKKAEGVLAEIILIRVSSSDNLLNKTFTQNIIEREEGRKIKTDLERIPFKRLKNKFADDEEVMKLILEAQIE